MYSSPAGPCSQAGGSVVPAKQPGLFCVTTAPVGLLSSARVLMSPRGDLKYQHLWLGCACLEHSEGSEHCQYTHDVMYQGLTQW